MRDYYRKEAFYMSIAGLLENYTLLLLYGIGKRKITPGQLSRPEYSSGIILGAIEMLIKQGCIIQACDYR